MTQEKQIFESLVLKGRISHATEQFLVPSNLYRIHSIQYYSATESTGFRENIWL